MRSLQPALNMQAEAALLDMQAEFYSQILKDK